MKTRTIQHRRRRRFHHWVLALVTAGLLVASVPGSVTAQRGRTDDGRRIERKSDARASKKGSKANVQRRSKNRGDVVRRNERRGDRSVRAGSRSGGLIVGKRDRDSDRRNGDWNRGDRNRRVHRNRNDRKRGDWNRGDRNRRVHRNRNDRKRGDWDRGDRYGGDWDRGVRNRGNRRGGSAIFVPPGLAKKHVKYHHRRARRSRVDVHVTWPWVIRLEKHWHPRVRARHVIHVNVGWGSSRRSARMEFETVYRQRVRHANRDYAVIDVDIEEVVIYRDGRYIGRVDRIPGHLSRATATVWRNGDLEYDRDLFVVGNSLTGFELISEEYRPNGRTRVRAGIVDLHSGRVRSISRSRLYDPYYPDRFYAQSLLPEDVAW